VTGLLCVYYKVPAADHAELAPRVRRFQSALRERWPALGAELWQRPQASGGIETWMEIYRAGPGLSDEQQAGIAQAAARAGLPGPRHAEAFIPLP
jgi:hypothetical protein